jgi:trimeric autotransporter adhesin
MLIEKFERGRARVRGGVRRLFLVVVCIAIGVIPAAGRAAGTSSSTAPVGASGPLSLPPTPSARQPHPVDFTSTAPVSGTWQPITGGPRRTGIIDAMVVAPDGDRYISASMVFIDDEYLSGLFRWHAGNWSQIAAFTDTASISALIWGDTSLYAGGSFTSIGGVAADRLARWDGQQWAAVGSGFSAPAGGTPIVSALAFDQGKLYVGGSFTAFNGVEAKNLARWDGASATAFGNFTTPVSAVAADGGKVYVRSENALSRWNGLQWFNMGSGGLNSVPHTLLAYQGRFLAADRYHVLEWTGTQWRMLGFDLELFGPAEINHLALIGGVPHVGLELSALNAAEPASAALRRWNGAAWENAGPDLSSITAMALGPDGLYLSGLAGPAAPVASALWRWNSPKLEALDAPLELAPAISALSVISDTAYIQANYDYTYGYTRTALMSWRAGEWANLWPRATPPISNADLGPVTAGDDGLIYGVAAFSDNTEQVVGYDGERWFTATLPIVPANEADSYEFDALRVISPTAMYLTGSMHYWSPTSAGVIFAWDGVAWSRIFFYLNENASEDLQPCGSRLYFLAWYRWPAGSIGNKKLYELTLAPLQVRPIQALGLYSMDVDAVACLGDEVYLAGDFIKTEPPFGEAPVYNHFIRWDGATTEAITPTGRIDALAVRGATLYAGGQFSAIDGVAASNIASWDGEAWQPLGDGVAGLANKPAARVTRLVVSGDDLYVGGEFWRAGGQPAQSLAIWREDPVIVVPPTRLFLPMLSR